MTLALFSLQRPNWNDSGRLIEVRVRDVGVVRGFLWATNKQGTEFKVQDPEDGCCFRLTDDMPWRYLQVPEDLECTN